jgi:hypothetical protein
MTEKEDLERAIEEMLSGPAPLTAGLIYQNFDELKLKNMTPTNLLRWIERRTWETHPTEGYLPDGWIKEFLQQWWLDHVTGDGKWRDVKVEKQE